MKGALDNALDRAPAGGGTVEVERAGSNAEIDVVDVDRLGVKVRGVRIVRET